MGVESFDDKPKPDAGHYYDQFADSGFYDKDAEATGWPNQTEVLINRAFQHIDPAAARSVLDLGAGTGITLEAIRQHAQPSRTVGVDMSPKMLALLEAKENLQGIEIVEDTIQGYVAGCQEKFDFISSFSVLEFLPNLPATLRDTAGLLNENGVLAITYVGRAEGQPPETLIDGTEKLNAAMIEYRWPAAEIKAALTESGLTIVDQVDDVHAQEAKGLDYNFIVAKKPAA